MGITKKKNYRTPRRDGIILESVICMVLVYILKYLRYLDCAKPRPPYSPPSRPFYQLRPLKIAKCNKQNILYAAHVPIYEMFSLYMYKSSPPTPLYTTMWLPDKVLGPLLNYDKLTQVFDDHDM